MNINYIYNKIACISPNIEVLLRLIYWNNVNILSRFKPRFHSRQKEAVIPVDFKRIKEVLKKGGVKNGSLLIVHSSYDSLKCTGLSPDEIIDALLELIGEEGTLAMPVIRRYKEQPRKGKEYITYNTDTIVCTYNVQKTPVVTGIIPYYLMLREDSVTSRHPLSTMTAIGPLARAMMEHNLDGDKPSSHGPNSSWKYCLDHNSLVIGLGIDLVHSLSIMHVAEESFSDWPVKDWYRERQFKIQDKDFKTDIAVKERKPKWGTLYFAEKNLKKNF
jgi:aminoglycoside 3-N-acetyltransferase